MLFLAHQLGHKVSTEATVSVGGNGVFAIAYARRRDQVDPQPLMIRLEPLRG